MGIRHAHHSTPISALTYESVTLDTTKTRKSDNMNILLTTIKSHWDCECEHNFIHGKAKESCTVCNTKSDSQPDSILGEVIENSVITVADIDNENNNFIEELAEQPDIPDYLKDILWGTGCCITQRNILGTVEGPNKFIGLAVNSGCEVLMYALEDRKDLTIDQKATVKKFIDSI